MGPKFELCCWCRWLLSAIQGHSTPVPFAILQTSTVHWPRTTIGVGHSYFRKLVHMYANNLCSPKPPSHHFMITNSTCLLLVVFNKIKRKTKKKIWTSVCVYIATVACSQNTKRNDFDCAIHRFRFAYCGNAVCFVQHFVCMYMYHVNTYIIRISTTIWTRYSPESTYGLLLHFIDDREIASIFF